MSGYRIVGCPRCIDDKKYARNAFIFNFVFVFTSSTATTPYEPIITKIGDTFRTCEVTLHGVCLAAPKGLNSFQAKLGLGIVYTMYMYMHVLMGDAE